MTHRALALLVAAALLAGGCAARTPRPSPLSAPLPPGPLLASFEAYNSGPEAVRLWGSLKAEGQGTVDFGATAVENVGLRLDALAGPFSTPVLALACRTGVSCTAFVPGRQTAYVDDAGRWDGLLGPLLRGRVPRLDDWVIEGAWTTASGGPALVLRGNGDWLEQVEFAPGGLLPRAVYLTRDGGPPQARIGYEEFGEPVGGNPFPRRVEVWLKETGKTYEIRFQRAEARESGVEESLFLLSLPQNTSFRSLRGKSTWEETGIPIWPPLRGGTTGTAP